MSSSITYPLTDTAKDAARDLIEAWGAGVLPQTMLFGHYVQGKIAIPTFFDLQGSQINYDKAPPRGVLFEFAHFNLVTVRTFRDASTLEVILMQELRNAVASDFAVSEYFLALNAAGVLNMNGGTVNITDGARRPGEGVESSERSPKALADTVRATLGSLPNDREDLEAALATLEKADANRQRPAVTSVIIALGRVLDDTPDDSRIVQAVGLLTAEMNGA